MDNKQTNEIIKLIKRLDDLYLSLQKFQEILEKELDDIQASLEHLLNEEDNKKVSYIGQGTRI